MASRSIVSDAVDGVGVEREREREKKKTTRKAWHNRTRTV
jgi:hypothetical protein